MLFGFKKKSLDPVLQVLTRKMDKVLETQDPAQKADRLVALKDEVETRLDSLAEQEVSRGTKAAVLALSAIGGLMLWAAPAALFVPTLALTGVFGLSIGATFKYAFNAARALHDKRVLENAASEEIGNLLEADPQAVASSAALRHSLRKAFAPSAHHTEDHYEQIRKRVGHAPKATP